MVEVAFLDKDLAEGSKQVEVGGDAMIVDGFPADASNQSRLNTNDKETGVKKLLKRKRDSISGNVKKCEDKESLVALGAECRQELDELLKYYKEVSDYKLQVGEGVFPSINSAVACLLEESSLPFSKLVDEIYEKLKAKEENQDITLASVRSAVLFVGQRTMYGITNADADVLEDESESCLWCWETREMKLLPTIQRGILNARRIARRKIHERVSALSATLSALSMPESYKNDLLKASEKLGRTLNETAIRSLVEKLKQKNDAEMAEKESKLKEKDLIKEFERNKRIAEKEQKRMDRELQKERLQTEKETKRLQDELIKEERRREKEEAELKKKHKKLQEEAERDQRHREKEEAELKKQLAIQKQATIMERFLKSSKSNNNSSDNSDKISPTKAPLFISPCEVQAGVDATTSLMDHALLRQNCLAEDLRQFHVSGWHKSCRSNRSRRWSVRRNPKIEVIKELKLQGPSSEVDPIGKVSPKRGLPCNKVNYTNVESPDKLVDGWEETIPDETSSQCNNYMAPTCVQSLIIKLLQFDKSHRPAYYGAWRRKSSVVGPRHPLKKDPDLDYDVDSDEEWEEEDPGESLSDCEKDEEECLEEVNLKSDDEDESEDGFFVPDGYLSENEGVEADCPSDDMEDDSKSSPCCKPEIESEESRVSQRHKKYLHNLTEQALRKTQPLVILNLMHEKTGLPMAEDLTGTAKLELICLQALCMQACPGGSITDISVNPDPSNEELEVCNSQNRKSTSPTVSTAVISEPDMVEFVGTIRAHSQGINKVVESLQRKFPTISKSQLRNKVREISDFVDNRWKVKKEVLAKLGLSLSPDKSRRPKGIATFFSKRCLPPVESMNIPESSQPSVKAEAYHG